MLCNIIEGGNKLSSQFIGKTKQKNLRSKWTCQRLGQREVIHYCPELDINYFQKTQGHIFKRFFSKLLNKRS